MSVAFDTLKFVERLEDGGFTHEQAKAAAQAFAEATGDQLVTKDYLDARLEAIKSDLLKWVIGASGFQTLVILGAVVALSRTFH